MYRRILVPLDGSAAASRGLAEALRLAKEQGARMRVLHVLDETVMLGSAEAGLDLGEVLAGLKKKSDRLLRRAENAAREAGVRAEAVVHEAAGVPAADAILAEARTWKADLIVMGTHGRRGVRRLVLGSDAENVVRRSACPVLLVRAA